jgi:hypothetical protein
MEGVSFVVPVHNGAACIRETLDAIRAQDDGGPMEMIAVDDHSDDRSSEILKELAGQWPLRIVVADERGAAAAINAGIRAARYPIICQVDQDVVLGRGWMRRLVAELDDPTVAAAQGYYASDRHAPLCARAMGLDLEQRYAAIEGRDMGHVCSGNAAYRAEALRRVGLFDETLGYGYDNDISYRLRAAGYRLTFCRSARSVHQWREGFVGYLVQQYGFGYGRIDVVAKHPRRFTGDSVSPAGMMAHPLLMSAALTGLAAAAVMAMTAGPWRLAASGATALIAILAVERLGAGIVAARRFRDPTALMFPILHLLRDLAWVAAIAIWSVRRLCGRPSKASHSMRARRGGHIIHDAASRPRAQAAGAGPPPRAGHETEFAARPARILGLIPAYNEAANLAEVVAELRERRPDLDILVVDDGSTDATPALLDRLDVRWLRFTERLGVGNAMRAGLRYAARLGYDVVVRMDGDGQHRADDIGALVAPIHEGRADVVLGSRYTGPNVARAGVVGLAENTLAVCLSALTGWRVTDPTSGFCVMGPRAVPVLAEHHPTGYPEPELRLFLSRNALRAVEVAVCERPRLGGKTSLTPVRMTAAGARVALAMIIVPLRCRVGVSAGD